jgi:hypothetical protein
MGVKGGSTPPLPFLFRMKQKLILGGFKMKATKNNVSELIEKEVEPVNFLDRHTFNWFIDTKTSELKIGKSMSLFLSGETENFQVKKLHSSDEKYWKLVETVDGKFVLLSRPKFLK